MKTPKPPKLNLRVSFTTPHFLPPPPCVSQQTHLTHSPTKSPTNSIILLLSSLSFPSSIPYPLSTTSISPSPSSLIFSLGVPPLPPQKNGIPSCPSSEAIAATMDVAALWTLRSNV
ncbi:hypothetical protein L211DRAFT_499416 [Terfezia boudieri ATCC MYA-4762]|uniref:Uncharacterized protein n=1 Tax=Terfezia boudieri ATCC MYA-4762 TaxID=1051890 RepID=A0A3N4LCT8_9PEZI|nr:hypothetical protein L211DRAFT_499416 [Terfezia boudieri ATCC MYA-4762]